MSSGEGHRKVKGGAVRRGCGAAWLTFRKRCSGRAFRKGFLGATCVRPGLGVGTRLSIREIGSADPLGRSARGIGSGDSPHRSATAGGTSSTRRLSRKQPPSRLHASGTDLSALCISGSHLRRVQDVGLGLGFVNTGQPRSKTFRLPQQQQLQQREQTPLQLSAGGCGLTRRSLKQRGLGVSVSALHPLCIRSASAICKFCFPLSAFRICCVPESMSAPCPPCVRPASALRPPCVRPESALRPPCVRAPQRGVAVPVHQHNLRVVEQPRPRQAERQAAQRSRERSASHQRHITASHHSLNITSITASV